MQLDRFFIDLDSKKRKGERTKFCLEGQERNSFFYPNCHQPVAHEYRYTIGYKVTTIICNVQIFFAEAQ